MHKLQLAFMLCICKSNAWSMELSSCAAVAKKHQPQVQTSCVTQPCSWQVRDLPKPCAPSNIPALRFS
jgi:hypothetical protein